jgi:hypothetical protein
VDKETFRTKAYETLIRFGAEAKVYLFDKHKTFNIPKRESELPDEDVDIFSSETDPANAPIEEDRHDDQITATYKSPKIIKVLLDTPVAQDTRQDGVQTAGEIEADLFTLKDEIVNAGLPLEREDWMNGYMEYEEDNKILKKKITKIEYNSRWGNEALGVDIYLGEDIDI